MSWAVGYDTNWSRWVGYGVPATCDHPGCGARIDRGLAYVCGDGPFGGSGYIEGYDEDGGCGGCGLYFCDEHLGLNPADEQRVLCERCSLDEKPFEPTPDLTEWLRHMLYHGSWGRWREDHPGAAREVREELGRRKATEAAEQSRRSYETN